jgi:hypothetical protein
MTQTPCAKCHSLTDAADLREHNGRQLCEDCFLDAMSAPRTCDPWAVHTAKSLKDQEGKHILTQPQQRFLDLVLQQGEVTIPQACQALGQSEDELRRDFAALRHMELLRAQKKGEVIVLIKF